MSDYTPEKLRAIDAEIAVKVLGWRWMKMTDNAGDWFEFLAPNDAQIILADPSSCRAEEVDPKQWPFLFSRRPAARGPKYSTRIADAWKVVEKLGSMWMDATLPNHGIEVSFGDAPPCTAPTAPLAICLAALEAAKSKRTGVQP